MQQLEQLKHNSLKCEEGMPVKWPKENKVGQLKPSSIMKGMHNLKHKRVYAYNAKAIAYIDDDALFVTPYSEESLGIVRDAGFVLREFFVPFSRGDTPQGEYGERWQELLASV